MRADRVGRISDHVAPGHETASCTTVPSANAVEVEVLFLRAEGGEWAYRRVAAPLGDARSPCDLARELAGNQSVVHSTSWRHEPAAGVVLTYIACPDPRPDLPAVRLPVLTIAHGRSADNPRPVGLRLDHVAAHAVRHFAYLTRTDPAIMEVMNTLPSMNAALGDLPTGLAGHLRALLS